MSVSVASVVVEVRDQRNAALVDGDGSEPLAYSSPPQPLDSALELVSVLLGHRVRDPGRGTWRTAIAGGHRQITLHRADRDGQLRIP